ncbi:DUF6268 family outer membrane beta-barrel protein [uncultured Lacinutrix sp.]|uniref:DUF6268 family outer membrane beta-barrel protein n=1 Tax=uncultured Lacinutrix sp. TaxID=574032 RepID=UPI00262DDB71|nr:DUF6268 family outer membrane beta-barrel protein [uncultured Lacinutrix sp.]
MNYTLFKIIAPLLFFFIAIDVQAQLTDLARIEYSTIPKSQSDERFERFRALINVPLKTKEDCYLILGAEYSRIALTLDDRNPFEVSKLNTLQVIDFNLGYTFKVSDKWRLGAKISPRIASTLGRKLSNDDLFLNGGIYAIKDRTKDKSLNRPYRLVLGLTYNSTTGIPLPLPFISYYRRVNKNWSYNLGIPKTNVKYFFNEHSIIQSFVGIDGYFANIQDSIVIENRQAESVSLSVVLAGLGYEYYFTKHLVYYGYVGHTLRMNNMLRDSNRNEVYKLDNVNAFYIRTGIKFKI